MHKDLSQETWPPKHLPAKPTEGSGRQGGPAGSPHLQDVRQISPQALMEGQHRGTARTG